jgi:outer membrane protein
MRAFVAAILVLVATPAQAGHYTLKQLLERVDADYSGVRAARAGVDAARLQLSLANRQWWPTGQVTFALTGSPEVRCWNGQTTFPNGTPDTSYADQATRQRNCVATTNSDLQHNTSIEQILPVHGVALNLSLTLTQPLYTFGKIESAQAAAKAGVEVARAEVDKQRADAAFNVANAYWGLKWARAAHATLDDGVSRLREWTKKINQDIDAGKTTYSEADLIRIKLATDSAELILVDIDKAREIALAGLRTLTNDPEVDIDDGELDVVELVDVPLSFYEDGASVHRPEARMLLGAATAASAQRRLRLGELMPDIGILGAFTYAYASSVDDPFNGFMNHPNTIGASLLLVFRYNLDVAQRLANYDKARADEQVAITKRLQALGGIAIELANRYYESKAARRRADLLAHSEKLARGWYNAVDQNLQVGVAEGRELTEAARAYFEARLRHLQAIMDANVSTAALRQAAGVNIK